LYENYCIAALDARPYLPGQLDTTDL